MVRHIRNLRTTQRGSPDDTRIAKSSEGSVTTCRRKRRRPLLRRYSRYPPPSDDAGRKRRCSFGTEVRNAGRAAWAYGGPGHCRRRSYIRSAAAPELAFPRYRDAFDLVDRRRRGGRAKPDDRNCNALRDCSGEPSSNEPVSGRASHMACSPRNHRDCPVTVSTNGSGSPRCPGLLRNG